MATTPTVDVDIDVMDDEQYADVFSALVDDLRVGVDAAADYIDSMRMEGLSSLEVMHVITDGIYDTIEGDGGDW